MPSAHTMTMAIAAYHKICFYGGPSTPPPPNKSAANAAATTSAMDAPSPAVDDDPLSNKPPQRGTPRTDPARRAHHCPPTPLPEK